MQVAVCRWIRQTVKPVVRVLVAVVVVVNKKRRIVTTCWRLCRSRWIDCFWRLVRALWTGIWLICIGILMRAEISHAIWHLMRWVYYFYVSGRIKTRRSCIFERLYLLNVSIFADIIFFIIFIIFNLFMYFWKGYKKMFIIM